MKSGDPGGELVLDQRPRSVWRARADNTQKHYIQNDRNDNTANLKNDLHATTHNVFFYSKTEIRQVRGSGPNLNPSVSRFRTYHELSVSLVHAAVTQLRCSGLRRLGVRVGHQDHLLARVLLQHAGER